MRTTFTLLLATGAMAAHLEQCNKIDTEVDAFPPNVNLDPGSYELWINQFIRTSDD